MLIICRVGQEIALRVDPRLPHASHLRLVATVLKSVILLEQLLSAFASERELKVVLVAESKRRASIWPFDLLSVRTCCLVHVNRRSFRGKATLVLNTLDNLHLHVLVEDVDRAAREYIVAHVVQLIVFDLEVNELLLLDLHLR